MMDIIKISVHSQHMGIMGHDIRTISSKWHCGYEHLVNNNASQVSPDIAARAEAIKELTRCIENRASLMDCNRNELMQIRDSIASF